MLKYAESGRLLSLDIFRGLTMAAMILVNNPGSWKHVYAPLRHARWHGWTPTDLIFPFFLFIVGVSLSFSLTRRGRQGGGKQAPWGKIARRTVILFGLGLLLAWIPKFDLSTLRIPGVLQRIALCYLITSVIFLKSDWKGRAAWAFALAAGYWILLKLVPVPGYGPGVLTLEGNLCGHIDVKLLAGHLYKPGFDPEGLLSTLPAVATTLLGALSGDWLRSVRQKGAGFIGLVLAGSALTAGGLFLHPYFPINKQLWTSTFVLFSGGMAMLCLAACYFPADILGWKKWAYPFRVFGTNAITAYVGSGLMARLLFGLGVSGTGLTLKEFITSRLLIPWAGPLNGSLLFALILILIWLLLLAPLYHKRLFIKI